MREVAIVGAGITDCKGRWVERSYYGLSQMATKEALKDAAISVKDVDAVIYGIYNDVFEFSAIPEHPLQGIIGMTNKPGMRVTCGGATGAYAMLTAYTWVASGLYDVVLCLGTEKATDCFDFESMTSTPEVIKTIGWSGDTFYERELGWTASDSYAEVVLAYMDEHPKDLKPEVSAKISEILCQQVQKNPRAQRYGEKVTAEMAFNSRYIVYPFKLLEMCVYTEGAGVVIFASKEKAKSICTPLGKADDLIDEGLMVPGGPILVNPSGGLTYGGHFVGGSNMFSCWSARKELIERELRRGLIHGTGSTIAQFGVAMVIERRS
jgi:acetyl-CoA C-acetyltransferase